MGKLSTLVEEATRSTEEGVKYFVEPAGVRFDERKAADIM
jgi:hypothetical protein